MSRNQEPKHRKVKIKRKHALQETIKAKHNKKSRKKNLED